MTDNSGALNKPEKIEVNEIKIEKPGVKENEAENIKFKENRIETKKEKIENDDHYAIQKDGEDNSVIVGDRDDQMQKEKEKQIEKILETGLEDAYLNMAPEKRLEFKRVGEETSKKIAELIDRGKAKAKKIVSLIRKWLSLIPGVNKFFLEQEAKIKTDEILKINNIK